MAISHFDREQREIARALAELPQGTFALRVFPGEEFRIGHRLSHFVNDAGEVQVVLQRLCKDGFWHDFGRETPAEIKSQIVEK